jgi:cell pole-organizing protein PopZ
MAEIKTEQEPSIEEILESIRQIISEDGTPVAEGQQKPAAKPAAEQVMKAPPAPAKQPAQTMAAPQAPAAAPAEETVLELTDKVEAAPAAAPLPQAAAAPEEQYKPRIVLEDAMEDDPLMSDMTAEAAVAAMARIMAQNIAVEREMPGKPGPVTLEDMAREMMHPLIKVWLDKNLPVIIEKLVAREIEKLARRALDKE